MVSVGMLSLLAITVFSISVNQCITPFAISAVLTDSLGTIVRMLPQYQRRAAVSFGIAFKLSVRALLQAGAQRH